MGRSAAEAYKPLAALEPYLPFRDASVGVCNFKLMPSHVICAIEKAVLFGWYNYATFDVDEYEFWESVDNGDLNVIVPGKFVAFAGPYKARFGPDGMPAKVI